jgi:hypothetical protein
MTPLVSCCTRIVVNQNKWPTLLHDRADVMLGQYQWLTDWVIVRRGYLYIHSVHKHRVNSFQRQNYKIKLKQRSLNWINSMQVKKTLFTNVFFSWSLCLLNVSIDGIPQAFFVCVFFRFVDIIVITVHDRFWNVGQANCILKI